MKRSIQRLQNETFDLTIIGAGIYGAVIAYEASLAGYKVALVEAEDFASQNSGNSFRVLHGGLRYLQHLNFRRMRRSIRSRRYFSLHAPHCIQPRRFAIPLKGRAIKSPWAMRCALALYDVLSLDRNHGIDTSQKIPRGLVLKKNVIGTLAPMLDADKYTGLGVWSESVMTQPERLCLHFAQKAYDQGACIVNHCLINALKEEDNSYLIDAKDQLSGKSFTTRSRWTIDCTGKNVARLNPQHDNHHTTQQWIKSANVVLNVNIGTELVVGTPVTDQLVDTKKAIKDAERMIFIMPHGRQATAGTFYFATDSLTPELTSLEQSAVVQSVQKALPQQPINAQHVVEWQLGFLPKAQIKPKANQLPSKDSLALKSHSDIQYLPSKQGKAGYISVTSVKFSTAPAVAADVLALIKKHDKAATPAAKKEACHTPERLPMLASPGLEQYLADKYGKKWPAVADFLNLEPQFLEPVSTGIYSGEIAYAVRYEMVRTAKDFLERRGHFSHRRTVFDSDTAAIVKALGHELQWDHTRTEQEIASLFN